MCMGVSCRMRLRSVLALTRKWCCSTRELRACLLNSVADFATRSDFVVGCWGYRLRAQARHTVSCTQSKCILVRYLRVSTSVSALRLRARETIKHMSGPNGRIFFKYVRLHNRLMLLWCKWTLVVFIPSICTSWFWKASTGSSWQWRWWEWGLRYTGGQVSRFQKSYLVR
jgi:hypothetical protein